MKWRIHGSSAGNRTASTQPSDRVIRHYFGNASLLLRGLPAVADSSAAARQPTGSWNRHSDIHSFGKCPGHEHAVYYHYTAACDRHGLQSIAADTRAVLPSSGDPVPFTNTVYLPDFDTRADSDADPNFSATANHRAADRNAFRSTYGAATRCANQYAGTGAAVPVGHTAAAYRCNTRTVVRR